MWKRLIVAAAVMLRKSEEEKENHLLANDGQVPRRRIIIKRVVLEYVQWFISKVFGSVWKKLFPERSKRSKR